MFADTDEEAIGQTEWRLIAEDVPVHRPKKVMARETEL